MVLQVVLLLSGAAFFLRAVLQAAAWLLHFWRCGLFQMCFSEERPCCAGHPSNKVCFFWGGAGDRTGCRPGMFLPVRRACPDRARGRP